MKRRDASSFLAWRKLVTKPNAGGIGVTQHEHEHESRTMHPVNAIRTKRMRI